LLSDVVCALELSSWRVAGGTAVKPITFDFSVRLRARTIQIAYQIINLYSVALYGRRITGAYATYRL